MIWLLIPILTALVLACVVFLLAFKSHEPPGVPEWPQTQELPRVVYPNNIPVQLPPDY